MWVPTPPPHITLFHRRQVLPNKQTNKPQKCSYRCLTFRHTDPTCLGPRATSHPVAVTGPLRTSLRKGHQQRHGGARQGEERCLPEPSPGLSQSIARQPGRSRRFLPLGLPLGSDPGPPGTGAAQPSPPGNVLPDDKAEASPTWWVTLTPASSTARRRPLPGSRQTLRVAIQGDSACSQAK